MSQNSFLELKLKLKSERLILRDSIILNLLLMPQNSFLYSKLKPKSEKLTLEGWYHPQEIRSS
jgi:hypothetical protein